MLNDEICKKRNELNKSIENGDEYSKIYRLSIELDELIAKYYNAQQKKEKSCAKNIDHKKSLKKV